MSKLKQQARRKLEADDSDEARKTATGHSCKPLAVSLERQLRKKTCFLIKKLLSLHKRLTSADTKI
jgi:hypothetical protein